MTVHHIAAHAAQRAARPWVQVAVLLRTLDAINTVLIAALLAYVISGAFLQRAGLTAMETPLVGLLLTALGRGVLGPYASALPRRRRSPARARCAPCSSSTCLASVPRTRSINRNW